MILVDTNVLVDIITNNLAWAGWLQYQLETALCLASKVFQHYRALKGVKTGVLPDFFIGAHATIAGIPLLTRDTRRYRFYFPTLTLISPTIN